MRLLRDQKIQPDWWTKSFAGAVLGLSLAFALAALITMWGLQSEHRGPCVTVRDVVDSVDLATTLFCGLFYSTRMAVHCDLSVIQCRGLHICVLAQRAIGHEGTYRYPLAGQRAAYVGRNLRRHSLVHLLFCRWAEYVSA